MDTLADAAVLTVVLFVVLLGFRAATSMWRAETSGPREAEWWEDVEERERPY